MKNQYGLGLDIGSTTVKIVIIDKLDHILYSRYERHLSDIRETIIRLISDMKTQFKEDEFTVMVTGSGGLSVSKWLKLPFIQEVVAGTKAVKVLIPNTDVAIELGGEDAKITYFRGAVEQRMNGTCAGGTGAFIGIIRRREIIEYFAKAYSKKQLSEKKSNDMESLKNFYKKDADNKGAAEI